MVKMDKAQIVPEILRVLSLEGQAILDCAKRLESGKHSEGFLNAIDWAREALDRGGKIVVTGLGKSGKVGQKIAATLCSTGSLAVFLHPTEGLHGDLGVVQPGDVVLALSYTGNTEELVRILPILKNRGVKVIGLVGHSHSKLGQECDAWIDAAVKQEACPHNLAPTTSTTLALALGDAFAVALMQLRGFGADSFAENHPGGSLGKRLNLKVRDLMIPLAQVGQVEGNHSMEEVIQIASFKAQGGVLVFKAKGQSHLLGLITDGDIRRALRHREKFFDLKASEAMTASPTTARPEMMARQALELMENRPSQISVLPVVDDQGNAVGLLRLHDLVRTF